MGMIIRANLFPIRMKTFEKNNFELELEVENEDDRKKMVSVELDLPDQVSLSTVGINTNWGKNIENFRPRGKVATKIPIYLSRRVTAGSHAGKIIVREHFREFGSVEREFRKELVFRIYE